MTSNQKFIAILTAVLTSITIFCGGIVASYRQITYSLLNDSLNEYNNHNYDDLGFFIKKSTLDKMESDFSTTITTLQDKVDMLSKKATDLGLDPIAIIGTETNLNNQIKLLIDAINEKETANEIAKAQEAKSNTSTNSTASTSISGNYKDGTFQGTAMGFEGNITVEITMQNDTITNVSVISQNESRPQNSLTTIPANMVSANTCNVDTVSGSTYTSVGLINACNNALNSAIADPAMTDKVPTTAPPVVPPSNNSNTNGGSTTQNGNGSSGNNGNGSSGNNGNEYEEEEDEYEDPENEEHEYEKPEDQEDNEDQEDED